MNWRGPQELAQHQSHSQHRSKEKAVLDSRAMRKVLMFTLAHDSTPAGAEGGRRGKKRAGTVREERGMQFRYSKPIQGQGLVISNVMYSVPVELTHMCVCLFDEYLFSHHALVSWTAIIL